MTEDWIIGFIWANGTEMENRHTHNKFIRIQSKDRELFFEIGAFLGFDIIERASGLKIIDFSQEHPVYQRAITLGWNSRKHASEGCYPLGSIDDLEFVRGYCNVKAAITYGYMGVAHGNKRYLELRIRGAYQLLFEINKKIILWIASKPRIVQKVASRTRLLQEKPPKKFRYFIVYAAETDVHALSKLLNIPIPDMDSGSRKEISIDCAKEVAAAKGGKCLSTEYLGSRTKLTWQCAEGHSWEATLTRVKCSGSWCPTCANIKQRLTIEEMQEIAKSRGGKCLSTRYVNGHTKLKWQCAQGHIWEAKPSDVKQGTWCAICSQKLAGQRTAGINTDTTEKLLAMQRLAESRGGKCLSDKYINSHMKLKWQCAEGHVWESIPNLVKNRKAWCPVCAHSKRRLAIEEMQKLAESKGGKCLSEVYVNSRTELTWQCAEGHTWKATSDRVKHDGVWCTICSRKFASKMIAGASSYEEERMLEMQNLAELRGGKCLSKAYVGLKKKLTWQCAKGHTWEAVPYQICRGTWCPVCDREKRMPTIEEMHYIAESRGGKCLSDEYVNSYTNLKWQCANGHIWEAVPYQVKDKGSWCPVCAHAKKRLTIEKMQEAAAAKGGRCLSDQYLGALTKLKWQCAEGHIWEATPSKIIHAGSWCKECYNESRCKKYVNEKD